PWSPVTVRQLRAFPAVKEPRVSRFLGFADAGPKLPGTVRGLPDAEIDRLLVGGRQFAEIRVAGNLPPIPSDARLRHLPGIASRCEGELARRGRHHAYCERGARLPKDSNGRTTDTKGRVHYCTAGMSRS